MNSEEDEFRRIEREAKRRAAHELADTQVYTIHYDQEWMCDQVSAELRGLRDQVQQLKSDLSEKVLNWTDLEAFANLAVAAEREAIAKLADASVNADQYPTLTMLAQAIRMRGD